MDDIKKIYENALTGKMTLYEVENWVNAVKPLYEQPPWDEMLHKPSGEELYRFIDQYADWEIRADEFNQSIAHYTKQVEKLVDHDPEQAVLLAKVNLALSKLSAHPLNEAMQAFRLGYILWTTKHYFDATEVLTKVVTDLRQWGTDPLLEVTALSYLSSSLCEDKQFDQALMRAEELQNRASQYHFRGQVALALRDKGQILESLGRQEEALDCLHQAIKMRKILSDEEVEQQAVIPLEAFLDAYGRAARRFGQFEEAITTFRELADRQKQAGNLALQAQAISDIGYTYHQTGETGRAIQYLQEAVHLAKKAGSAKSLSDAARWQMQMDLMSGTISADASSFEPIYLGSPIKDASMAYQRHVRSQQLLHEKYYDDAVSIALSVLEWAQQAKDTLLEINVRNTLGSCYMNSDQMTRAIDEFQKGIQLADGTTNGSYSLLLRYHLAIAYIMQHKYQESENVLLSGIAFSQNLLGNTEASEFRQQILAGSLALYELYAWHKSLLKDHKALIATTELVRTRNLYNWMRTAQCFESPAISVDVVNRSRHTLTNLRSVEVELEVRHLTSNINALEIALLQQRRKEAQVEVNTLLQQAGFPRESWDWTGDFSLYEATDKLLEEVLQPGLAIICLFSIPEGICPVVLYRQEKAIRSVGQFINWERDERQEALVQWTGNKDFRQGRGILSICERDASHIGSRRTEGLDRLPGIFRERMIDPLVRILGQIQVQKVVIIPQGELVLIPYWELMDRCSSIESITLAPSLNVLRLCLTRQRPVKGQTVLVGDLTHSLAQAIQEIAFVEHVRKDGKINKPNSVDEFQHVSQSCSLLHIAAHGLFNTENPYYSGFLAAKRERAEGMFVQYASSSSFQLSSKPSKDSIRLITVAECLAKLSLNLCRLAVLSTCESGIARQHGGGEMTGLPNSLLVAGAKSVIASLWRVHDTATTLLMRYFYETWEGGTGKEPSPACALAVARQKLRTATREEIKNLLGPTVRIPEGTVPFAHPIYTDAFHCFGSW